ncbi:DnaJ domain-containing protein [uncultured Bartonella sp.]|uniref:J domain-containing protein n=1 Tax=uncultured Bartonella sp. TaxID=104108 RepID=UPI002605C477|nr:DnaJ domain-containing protein [uncultured Bartonella sp.]
MTTTSKLFDSIRISTNKKKKAEPQAPECQWEGCNKPGTHPAPAGRDHEGQYLHFCIDHVREYNKNFNYFSGLKDDEIAKFQKDALTGHRPTWKAGVNAAAAKPAADFSRIRSGSAAYQNRVNDTLHMFSQARASAAPRKLKTLEAKAFITLGLEATATSHDIKAKYKALVKLNHPDANGGDRSSEDRLREVLKAYNLLKSAGFC